MASLAASAASPLAATVGGARTAARAAASSVGDAIGYPAAADIGASPLRVASTSGATDAHRAADVALPARSATIVRIAGLAGLCATTLVAPALLFVWLPILFGVPHIASDIRFLVLPLPRRQLVVSVAACVALVALKALSLTLDAASSGISLVRAEAIVVATWLVMLVALNRPRRSHARARHAPNIGTNIPLVTNIGTNIPLATNIGTNIPLATNIGTNIPYVVRKQYAGVAWVVVAFAAMIVISLPIQFAFVAAFAHNIVAIIAWLVVKRPPRVHALATIGAIALGTCVILAAGAPWLVAFTFLQGVHYLVWLDWMPRGAPRMPTKPWMLVVIGLMAVLTAALVDPMWARGTYLALATFHIYLELVVLGARLARRYA